jgi:hypothetical protein
LKGKELEDAKRKMYAKRMNFGVKSHSESDDEDDLSSDGDDPANS